MKSKHSRVSTDGQVSDIINAGLKQIKIQNIYINKINENVFSKSGPFSLL
uniref:Uncharacterized protein n=1 Tax=Anguilla anguilla TaxID=7936 RepID=A0A0E9T0U9_ANGAN